MPSVRKYPTKKPNMVKSTDLYPRSQSKIKCLIICFFLGFSVRVSAQEIECEAALASVHTDSLLHFLNQITGRDAVFVNGQNQLITSRYAFHPDNNLAADYLKQRCEQYGYQAEDIPFSATGRNIVMYKRGTLQPKTAFLLSAHYDCVGNINEPFEGADDNGSGVATLLEAARVLQYTNFPYTIVLAFWDEEEIGLLGSEAFAPDGPLGFWDVKGVINMDMVAYDGNKDSLAMIHTFPVGNSVPLATRLVELNKLYGIGLKTMIKNPGETSTDHQSFWLTGATAIGLTEDYDADFNPHWHQLSDRIENLNIAYYGLMARLAIVALCDIGKSGKVTAVKDLDNLENLHITNPVTNWIKFNGLDTRHYPLALKLYNGVGELLLNQQLKEPTDQLNISGFSNGIYFLQISNGTYMRYEKLLKVSN